MSELITPFSVQEWLSENSVNTVRVMAVNYDGQLMGKYLAAGKFIKMVSKGIALPDTIYTDDMGGGTRMCGYLGDWRGEMADILMMPDLATLRLDPRLEGLASVFSDLVLADGNPVPNCVRTLLKQQIARLEQRGFNAGVAIELEGYVFEDSLAEARNKQFQNLTPLGNGKKINYQICLPKKFLNFMGNVVKRIGALEIPFESWLDEGGISQFEINVSPSDPLAAADGMMLSKLACREVADEMGHCVTFMPVWDEDATTSGCHINISLQQDGSSVFFNKDRENGISGTMQRFLAGLMETLPGATSFAYPSINAFRRMVDLSAVPTRVVWGHDNKTAAIRTLATDAGSARIEYRTPSSDVNPYLMLAALLAGGLAGLDEELQAPAPHQGMAWMLPEHFPKLPDTILKAYDALKTDQRLRQSLGDEFIEIWLASRRYEWWSFHTQGGCWMILLPCGRSSGILMLRE